MSDQLKFAMIVTTKKKSEVAQWESENHRVLQKKTLGDFFTCDMYR